MSNLRLIIASTSTVFGSGYLEYLRPELINHFQDIDEILFIPFAQPGGISMDDYTEHARSYFRQIGIKIRGIHSENNSIDLVKNAQGIFVGGGNSFILINELHKSKLIDPIRKLLLSGKPYLGTSAGSNILGPSIMTTNDMPIVYPPSFKALNLVPFLINPHFVTPDVRSKHMGETRDMRIKEFLHFNKKRVVGLREGSYFILKDGILSLKGTESARVFQFGIEPIELGSGQNFQFLLSNT